MKFNTRAFFVFLPMLVGISVCAGFVGCSSPKPAQQEQPQGPTKYQLNGRVVSIDKTKEQLVVDGADIPGFMSAMSMPYSVKNSNLLEPLAPEDQITADVMVNGNDVWLENIVVVKKPDQAKATPSKEASPTPPPSKQK